MISGKRKIRIQWYAQRSVGETKTKKGGAAWGRFHAKIFRTYHANTASGEYTENRGVLCQFPCLFRGCRCCCPGGLFWMGIDPQCESSSVLIVRLWRLISAVWQEKLRRCGWVVIAGLWLMKERRCDIEECWRMKGCRCELERWPLFVLTQKK